MADPCAHEDVHFHLNIQTFGNTNIKYLEVTGHCTKCSARLQFRGPAGVSPDVPTVSAIDGHEASFPFLFDGETYDGKAIGYAVSFRGGN